MLEALQSTTIRVPLKLYLSSDHISVATGKTLAVVISKNGAAFANPSAGATNATEIANGWYYVDLSTTDTGTLGPLIVRGTATSCDDSEAVYQVVKATNRGTTALPDTACTTNASLITSGTGTDQLQVTAGLASSNAKQINGVATTSVTTVNANVGTAQPTNYTGTGASALVKCDTVDIAGAAVSTSTAQLGVNLVNIAGSAVSTASAQLGVNLVNIAGSAVSTTSAQLGVNLVNWSGSAPNALVGGKVDAANVVRSGTAQAGGATSITLDSGASATTNAYAGCQVQLLSGTGASAGQVRTITAYNGTTKVATVDYAWETNPDGTSVFAVLAADAPALNASLQPTAASLSGVTFPANFSSLAITAGGAVTVGTNNDKTGYSLTQAFPSNFSSLSIDVSGRVDLGKILGTASAGAAGYVGIDWGHVNAPTTAVSLSGTTISTSQAVASVSGAVGSVTAAVTLSAGDSPTFYTGTATAGGATTLTDSGAAWTTNALAGCRVKITSGTGAKQSRVVVSNTATALTVDRAWATNPDSTSVYAVVEGDGPKTDASLQVTAGTVADKTGYSLSVTPPTAAQVATAVWTDTTASDFTTASSPGKILVTQLGGAFTTTSSSVYTAAALANAPGGGNVTVGGYAANQDPATLVLGATASSWNTAGTIGAKINSAASAGDPWSTSQPGSYAAGTFGYLVATSLGTTLPAVKAKTDLIVSGVQVTLTSPVAQSGNVTLTRGDDYKLADGRALLWSGASANIWPDLTGSTVTFAILSGNTTVLSVTGAVVAATGTQQVRAELTKAQTLTLTAGWSLPYKVTATLADGDTLTLVAGTVTVSG